MAQMYNTALIQSNEVQGIYFSVNLFQFLTHHVDLHDAWMGPVITYATKLSPTTATISRILGVIPRHIILCLLVIDGQVQQESFHLYSVCFAGGLVTMKRKFT